MAAATAEDTHESNSDEILEFVCFPCYKKNKRRNADRLCTDCCQYFCMSCLQHHDEIFVDHKKVGPQGFHFISHNLPADKCEEHKDKLIDLFCKDHNKLVCSVCAYFKHRICKDVVYIPTEVQMLFSDADLQEVINNAQCTRDDIIRNGTSIGKVETSLEDSKNQEVTKVKQHGKNLVSYIEKMVDASCCDIEHLYDTLRQRLHDLKTNLAKSQSFLDDYLAKMEACRKNSPSNMPQLFVTMTKCQDELDRAKEITDEVSLLKGRSKINFEIDMDIEESLANIKDMGVCFEMQLLLVKNKEKINIKTESDGKGCCFIYGSCVMENGNVLITDCRNNQLKLLDMELKEVKDTCKLAGRPYGVCLVNEKEAAVSLGHSESNSGTLQFVSLAPSMMPIRSINISHFCWGLAHKNGLLYISDRSFSVYAHDMDGLLLKTYSNDQLLKQAQHLIVHRGYICVADCDRGLIIADKLGKKRYNNVANAYGVCTDGHSYFVCGRSSNDVIQMTQNGEVLGTVANQSDGILHPMSLAFDIVNKRLVVTQDDSDYVLVFHMK